MTKKQSTNAKESDENDGSEESDESNNKDEKRCDTNGDSDFAEEPQISKTVSRRGKGRANKFTKKSPNRYVCTREVSAFPYDAI